jgi:hypothetical protein
MFSSEIAGCLKEKVLQNEAKENLNVRTRCAIFSCVLLVAFGLQAADELTPISISARIHLLQSNNEPALHTTLSEEDVKRVLGKVNKIWSQANIHIELESIVKTTAVNDKGVEKDAAYQWVVASVPPDCLFKSGLNIFYVKDLTDNGFFSNKTGLLFVKDTAKLTEVPGGVDEPIPRVTSHEIGHALGLQHRQEMTNLMASKKSGFLLNEKEIELARATATAKFGTATKEEKQEQK